VWIARFDKEVIALWGSERLRGRQVSYSIEYIQPGSHIGAKYRDPAARISGQPLATTPGFHSSAQSIAADCSSCIAASCTISATLYSADHL
jgi:hypothetical protein